MWHLSECVNIKVYLPCLRLLLQGVPCIEGQAVEVNIYVTEPAKTGLVCTKYTYSFYHIYLFFCVGYTISKFYRKFCVAINF